MKLKTNTKTIIKCQDWDNFVCKTYNKIYQLQQQDGCMLRGLIEISVPVEEPYDFENIEIPEIVNHREMGVNFESWLKRDVKTPLKNQVSDYELDLWWSRNFYPSLDMIVNDLYAKGLLEKGEYTIEIH
jgi:hypothetical protein